MKLIDEFKAFALRGNALDLAVGVVIGASFGAITTSLVGDIISPLLSLFTGGINLSDLTFMFFGASILYGQFLQTLINFLIIAFALFVVIKLMNTIARKEKQEAPLVRSDELRVLEEIRDILKK